METVTMTERSGKCVSCELCRAICPEGAIRMMEKGGQYLPVIAGLACSQCGLCVEVCPGLRPDPHGLISNQEIDEKKLAGRTLSCWTAKLKDSELLLKTASGGAITGMAIELLKRGRYDCISILDPVGSATGIPRLRFSDNPDEIIQAAKSKYVPASAYELIQALEKDRDKRFVIIATPCVLDGIRSYDKIRDLGLDRVLTIGLFCSHTMNLNFIEYIRRRYAKADERIELLDYRSKLAGGWPGNMRVVFSSGRTIEIDRNERMELKPYFTLKRCHYCFDNLNRSADISLGDCYVERLEDRAGKTNLIIRTQKGLDTFSCCKEVFHFEALQIEEILSSQGHKRVLANADRARRLMEEGQEQLHSRMTDSATGYRNAADEKRAELGRNLKIPRIRIDRIARATKGRVRKVLLHVSSAMILCLRVFVDAPALLSGVRKEARNDSAIAIIPAGYKNRGAQALALTTMDMIRRKHPDADILFCAIDYEQERDKWEKFRIRILPWDNLIAFQLLCPEPLRTLYTSLAETDRSPDALEEYESIGMYYDISGFGPSSKRNWKLSLMYVVEIMVAKKQGAAIQLMPQSFGPWDYPLAVRPILNILFKLYFRYPVKIFTREQESRQYIKRFARESTLSHDIVLLNEGYCLENILRQDTEQQILAIEAGTVGIIPNYKVFERMNPDAFFRMYRRILELLKDAGRKAYLMSYSDEDRVLCQQIYERNRDLDILRGMLDDMDTLETENAIRQFSFVVASRYHSIIHAYKNYVPSVVIGWAQKYEGLLDSFRQSEYLFSLDSGDNEERIVNMTLNMLDKHDAERVRIRNRLEDLKQENTGSVEFIE